MFLKQLMVSDRNGVVRDISFKKGLNLVYDLTTTDAVTESGNDVGKTTFLRVIDFCLGSDGSSIYTDSEFKTKNEQVYNYLLHSNVQFELTIESAKGVLHKIQRSLQSKPFIDGQEFGTDLEDFKIQLGRLILGLKTGKPTYRQLIKKFVRIDNYEMSNTIKYLHPSTPEDAYEQIYLYLFGFENQDLLTHKSDLVKNRKKLMNQKLALKEFSHEALKQMLFVIEKNIKELEQKKAKFEITDNVINEIKDLEGLRKNVSELSLAIGKLRIKFNLSLQTIDQLKRSKGNIDPRQIRALYDEAKAAIPNLQRSFEDVLGFHQSMLTNKITFIERSLGGLEAEIADKDRKLRGFLAQEKTILGHISNKGAFEDLQKIERELYVLHEEKGKKLSLAKTLEELQANLNDITKKLQTANDEIAQFEEELEKKLKDFNTIFADFSRLLYDEQYVLSFDDHEGKSASFYRFKIDNVKGNVGSGKKKGQTTAFDLAYLKFLSEYRASIVRFIIHDKLEEIHVNQLKTLFEIANDIDGQYIVAILKDKLQGFDLNLVEKNSILTLSQEDKFFKL